MTLWWRHNILTGKWLHKITSTTHNLSIHVIKNGGHPAFWGARAQQTTSWFLHVFAHRRARGFLTLTGSHDLVICQKWLKINGYQSLMYQESKSLKKFEFFISVRAVRALNARTNAHARKFQKCSEWSQMYSRLIKIEFWAFWNFDALVRARRDAHAVMHATWR